MPDFAPTPETAQRAAGLTPAVLPATPPCRSTRGQPSETVRTHPFIAGAALLSLIAVANAAAAWLLPQQIDLTGARSFTLAPQTTALFAQLTRPLEISLVASREPKTVGEQQFAQAAAMLGDLLDQLRAAGFAPQIHRLDPVESTAGRDLLARYPEAVAPCVVIEYAGRHETLAARDLAEFHQPGPGRPSSVEFTGEAALTAAVARLSSRNDQAAVYTLTGHGELQLDEPDPASRRGMGLLAERLRALDIAVRPLDLRTEPRVPADAAALIIAGGETPPQPAEIDAVVRYLAHGGRALLLCDTSRDPLNGKIVGSGWAPVLHEYGIELGNDRIVTRGMTDGIDALSPARPASSSHPLVRSLPLAPVLLYECRSVARRNDVDMAMWQVEPLLMSYPAPDAWAEGDAGAGTPTPGGEHDRAGPVTMAAAVERRLGSARRPVLVVVGDAEFVANHALSQPGGRSGLAFALSAINWLRGRRELLGDIPPRHAAGYVLAGPAWRQRGLVWKPTLALCALLFAAGATVWVSRRR